MHAMRPDHHITSNLAAISVYVSFSSCTRSCLQGRTLLGRASIVQQAAASSADSATASTPCNSSSSSCRRPYAAAQYTQHCHPGVLHRTRPARVTAAAVPSKGSSSGQEEAAEAADGDDADYADLAEDDNIILLGSADEEDDEFDSYDGTAAAVQRPAGQVVSSAMSEDEFRAAMAAARQQVRPGWQIQEPCSSRLATAC